MTRSMTAYAREEADADWGTASWELRSVNHRYLDPTIRLPEELRSLEAPVRERVAGRLKRGKVECTLRFRANAAAAGALALNLPLARRIVDASRQIQEIIGERAAGLSAAEVLRWPGMIEQDAVDTDSVGTEILALLDRALGILIETREREGSTLKLTILERCDQIVEIVARVRTQLPGIVEGQRERLRERLAELAGDLDAARLEQEIVLFANKVDVSEELDRLGTHVTEVRRVLEQSEPVGRRLDFLMQELNREANTLGSKSAVASTTQASVDLKVLIEQMREQIQNLE